MAMAEVSLTVWYISLVRALACKVSSFSFSARLMISSESVTPSLAFAVMSDVFCSTSTISLLIASVFWAVCSMLAETCCAVVELLLALSLTVVAI